MPYATNALDRSWVYFEDDGGDGTPVVLHGGIIDSVDLVRESNLAQALQELPTDEFRLIYVAHLGVGHSDQVRYLCYQAVAPPSTTRVWPVM
jgi:pimeloyl-ACP methyl ester carboxylesterase